MEYPCGKISIYFGPMQQTKIQYISFKVTTSLFIFGCSMEWLLFNYLIIQPAKKLYLPTHHRLKPCGLDWCGILSSVISIISWFIMIDENALCFLPPHVCIPIKMSIIHMLMFRACKRFHKKYANWSPGNSRVSMSLLVKPSSDQRFAMQRLATRG